MTGTEFYSLQDKDIDRGALVLRDAFKDDPLWNAVFENEPDAEEKLLAFYEAPLRYCRKYGQGVAPSPVLEGIAAWVPGKLADMTPWRMIRCGVLKAGMRIGMGPAKRLEIVSKTLGKDRWENLGRRSFIYLTIIGVASTCQGLGLGGLLLGMITRQSEHLRLPVYLETEKEENIGFYEKFGFHIIKEIMLPQLNLPMWEMIREPASSDV